MKNKTKLTKAEMLDYLSNRIYQRDYIIGDVVYGYELKPKKKYTYEEASKEPLYPIDMDALITFFLDYPDMTMRKKWSLDTFIDIYHGYSPPYNIKSKDDDLSKWTTTGRLQHNRAEKLKNIQDQS